MLHAWDWRIAAGRWDDRHPAGQPAREQARKRRGGGPIARRDSTKGTPARPEIAPGAAELAAETETVRQQIARCLRVEALDFAELRFLSRLGARELEAELRHLSRSARAAGGALDVTPPLCESCSFDFPGREARHLRPPSRCPRCRSQDLRGPRFRLRERG